MVFAQAIAQARVVDVQSVFGIRKRESDFAAACVGVGAFGSESHQAQRREYPACAGGCVIRNE
jgi:hypothetical protein